MCTDTNLLCWCSPYGEILERVGGHVLQPVIRLSHTTSLDGNYNIMVQYYMTLEITITCSIASLACYSISTFGKVMVHDTNT